MRSKYFVGLIDGFCEFNEFFFVFVGVSYGLNYLFLVWGRVGVDGVVYILFFL